MCQAAVGKEVAGGFQDILQQSNKQELGSLRQHFWCEDLGRDATVELEKTRVYCGWYRLSLRAEETRFES